MAYDHLYEYDRATQAEKYPHHGHQIEPVRIGYDIEKIDPASVSIK
jgi:hypothetical protein